jgi:hypothetical protein
MEGHICTGVSASLGHGLHSREPGRIGTLAMQQQAMSRAGEAARDGSADPGPAAGND